MKKPNIILINCDDLGYGDFGCYGSTVNKTPTIDKMASEGMLLKDFYMASPVCSPSRGGMLTGCYPPRISFGDFDGGGVLFPGQGIGIHEQETTIASMLKESGYNTMMVGKWHCGDQPEFLPTRRGFDDYYGLPYSNDMGIQAGNTCEMPPLPLMLGEDVVEQQPDQTTLTERYVERANTFIHANRDNPFFLYFAHMHVHLPLYAPQRFMQQSTNGSYGACVECVDWALECLLWQLKQDGIAENTLVILTSDNGSRGDNGGSNGPLRGKKGTTWEGGQRVPCIMYWPEKIQPRQVCSHVITAMDFLPTFAAISGTKLEAEHVIDGVDFSGLLLGSKSYEPRETFFYYMLNRLEAVRHKNWKLHVSKEEKPVKELYNLAEDVGEKQNQYNQQAEIVSKMMAILEECRKDLGDSLNQTKGRGVRSAGRVDKPRALTSYSQNHPYIIAMYDSEDHG